MTNPTNPSPHPKHALGWKGVALLAIAHAVIFVLAFTPGLGLLVFLVPTPLVLAAIGARRTRTLLGWVFLAQLPAWLYLQAWIDHVSTAGWPTLATYLALVNVLLAWVLRRFGRSPRLAGLPLALLVPIAWTGVEYLRGAILFGGYPWFMLGQPTIQYLPLAQVADLGGYQLAGLLPAIVGGLLADHLCPSRSLAPTRRRIALAATLGLLLLVPLYGVLRMQPEGSGPAGPNVLLVQTNLPASNKTSWTPEEQVRDARAFALLTLEGQQAARADGIEPDIAVWPETMLPGPGLEPESIEVFLNGNWFPGERFRALVKDLRSEAGIPLLLGSTSFEGLQPNAEGDRLDWTAHYNSVYLVDRELPDARYDKIVLTPFGETMPLISRWPWLEEQLLAFGAAGMAFNLDAGNRFVRFPVAYPGGEVEIATPICFEDTVPSTCRSLIWQDGEKVADLMVNTSNDGWFGRSDSTRRIHLEVARFRAIENRVPLLRAANTGLSALVDSSGRLVARTDPRVATTLLVTPHLDDRWTLFAAIGQLPVIMLSILALLGLIATIQRTMPAEPGEPE